MSREADGIREKVAPYAKEIGFETFAIICFDEKRSRIVTNLRNNDDLMYLYITLHSIALDIEKKCVAQLSEDEKTEIKFMMEGGKNGHNRDS